MSRLECMCCASINDAPGVPRPPRPAAYWWTGPNGYPQPICEDCCAWWLLTALEDDWLAPQHIEPVAGVMFS